MKYLLVLAACLVLTAFVSAQDETTAKIEVNVKKLGGGKMELSCTKNKKNTFKWTKDGADVNDNPVMLEYKDEDSGEYKCTFTENEEPTEALIYVKFRTCDNCIELDVASILGIAIGDIVATTVIGVAVYLIASQAGISSVSTSAQKKSSDRQHLVPNEMTSRGGHEQYERLKPRVQKDTYDVISKR